MALLRLNLDTDWAVEAALEVPPMALAALANIPTEGCSKPNISGDRIVGWGDPLGNSKYSPISNRTASSLNLFEELQGHRQMSTKNQKQEVTKPL